VTHGAVGIVVVTHNSEDHIGACLEAAATTDAELVVVDNASEDRTRDEVVRRGMRLISNTQNRGFAAAVNQGIRNMSTPFVLLLNPDAVIEGGIEELHRCCERPGTGGAGGKLVDAGGRPQVGFMVRRFPSPWTLVFEALLLNRLWPRNPINWNYRCLGLDYVTETEVEQPAGAFLMLRRDLWEKLGGFDEGFYPVWFEDVDFCLRARAAGYRMWYVPKAVAKHTGAHSLPRISLEIRALYWYRSFLRYAVKHFGPWEGRMVSLAVLIGSGLRMIAGIAASRSLKPIVVYGRVMGLAGRCFLSVRCNGSGVPFSS
jgi:GT2 family glycosyltransferase